MIAFVSIIVSTSYSVEWYILTTILIILLKCWLMRSQTRGCHPFIFRVLCKTENHKRSHFTQTANRGISVFLFVFCLYIYHYSATDVNPFHFLLRAETTTEMNHTGKQLVFIRSGIIVERIIFYQCNHYLCLYHDIAWTSSWKRYMYV